MQLIEPIPLRESSKLIPLPILSVLDLVMTVTTLLQEMNMVPFTCMSVFVLGVQLEPTETKPTAASVI